MKKVFKKDFLIEELGLPECALEDTIVEVNRWTITCKIIFEHEGRYYTTWYDVGATESQDESPWEYVECVECFEVEERICIEKKWKRIEEEHKFEINALPELKEGEMYQLTFSPNYYDPHFVELISIKTGKPVVVVPSTEKLKIWGSD